MIRNAEALVTYLAGWMKDQAEKAGAKGATIGVSGGIDSALTVALAVQAFGRHNVMGVLMPCNSSQSSVDRGMELVKAFEIPHETVVLVGAFQSITKQVNAPSPGQENFCYGALRSCLRAPTLDYVAKVNNHLVYGTGNRDEDMIFRYFQKRGDGAVDSNTIAPLHKSEVYELSRYLKVPQSIIDAVPTADLWGADSGQEDEKELGISYTEIEWATREHDRIGYLYYEEDHFNRERLESKRCEPYTDRQWEVMNRARQAERSTRHKAVPPAAPQRHDMVARGWII